MSVTITTPRLIIRPPTLDDVEAFQRAKEAVWPELQKWMSWSSDDQKGVEATRVFIETRGVSGTPCDTALCAFSRETGDFVMTSGLDRKHDISDMAVAETGYWNAPEYLRQGFATEATNAVLRYAFEACRMDKVAIGHAEHNIPSKRIIEKMGFVYTHTNTNAHKNHFDNTTEDEIRYERTNANGLPPLDVSWKIG